MQHSQKKREGERERQIHRSIFKERRIRFDRIIFNNQLKSRQKREKYEKKKRNKKQTNKFQSLIKQKKETNNNNNNNNGNNSRYVLFCKSKFSIYKIPVRDAFFLIYLKKKKIQ